MPGTALGLGLLGLLAGSFLTALVARSDEHFGGLLTGRSRCPACHAKLAARDLVPVASWLLLRGKCRYCLAAIPATYPATELAAAAIGAVAGWLLMPAPAVVTALLGWWLLGLASIDLRSFRLPDGMTLPLIPAGLALALFGGPWGLAMPSPPESAIGAAAGCGVLAGIRWLYGRLRGREGLGLGDAKLLAAAGAWLGVLALPWLLLIAAGSGLAVALVTHRSLRADLAIPFGPPLALAFWLLFVMAQIG